MYKPDPLEIERDVMFEDVTTNALFLVNDDELGMDMASQPPCDAEAIMTQELTVMELPLENVTADLMQKGFPYVAVIVLNQIAQCKHTSARE